MNNSIVNSFQKVHVDVIVQKVKRFCCQAKFVAANNVNGVWWIVERGDANEWRILEFWQQSQQTRPTSEVVKHQIKFETFRIISDHLQTFAQSDSLAHEGAKVVKRKN